VSIGWASEILKTKGVNLLMFGKISSKFSFFQNNKPGFLDITKYGYEQYQDIIINNAVIKKATDNHETEGRYETIKEVLNRYRRPFDMLDIGASQGYYSFRAAHDYDCVCVMIEGDNPSYPMVGAQLCDLCKLNALGNIILLNKKVIPEDLLRLSECESFSVVLALNIIHWFGPLWKEVADTILNLGDNIIIETPPEENHATREQNFLRKSIEDYLISRKATIIGKAPRHTSANKNANIYLLETEKKALPRKHWLASENRDNPYIIASDYRTKTITKRPPHAFGLQVNNWQPGINLMTFLMCNGAYPERGKIKLALKNIQNHLHNDWTANNMILQGNRLVLIDWNDPAHGSNGGRRSSPRVLKAHLHLVDLIKPAAIQRYFWNYLIKT